MTFGSIVEGQGSQVAKANALFDALSPAALYAKDAANVSGLNIGLFGGWVMCNGVRTSISDYTGVLSASTINYVEANPATGAISKNTTGFTGERGLYTQTFAVAMNKAAYDKLAPDLKKVIDANSGLAAASMFGAAMDAGDKAGLAIAQKAGNKIITLDEAETQRWRRTASGVRAVWYKEVGSKGIDGPKLAAEAEALLAKAYAGK